MTATNTARAGVQAPEIQPKVSMYSEPRTTLKTWPVYFPVARFQLLSKSSMVFPMESFLLFFFDLFIKFSWIEGGWALQLL